MMNENESLLSAIPVGAKAPLRIPNEFGRLYDLAYNMWWSWDPVAYQIWSQLDPRAWVASRNPLSLLQVVDAATWDALASNATFIDLYSESIQRFDDYLTGDDTWCARLHGQDLVGPIAYLSAEYGIHQKLPLYSGGLGVLSGDHLKAASDLGLPLFGVGILYRRGYFRQNVDPDGWQQHIYSPLEISRRPVREVLDPRSGRPLRVDVLVGRRTVAVGAWRLDIGRVPLILIDCDLPENDPADRPITHTLYVRGREMRFVQEMVLGIGGTRVIETLGLDPVMWHVNEGHAALSLLERLSKELEAGADREDAIARIKANTLFTLHTPVPAGNEVFDLPTASGYLDGTLDGVSQSDLLELGASGDHPQFDLGALAIRLSAITNGVSKRHAEVVTQDWRDLIGGEALAVTNGIHPQTWVGRNIERQFRRAVGDDWIDRLANPEEWKALHDIEDEDLWRAHEAQKELMLRRLRGRLREEFARHGHSPERLRWIDDQLPPSRLTIVFARRFATYKRAGLIFSDAERITSILTDNERPVQLIFSGKAHPADREGQDLVRRVVEMTQRAELEGHVYFIEDYDMQVGRTLVSGADVWLNNPRPPKEASGTSGMKAAANGALNLSVLDGWWVEGFNGKNGWGWGEHHESDEADAAQLYELLETEVVPLFYERDQRGIPAGWVAMMKESMVTAMSAFTAHRQVIDYTEKAYLPLSREP
jgi:starch phosphorylase